MSIERYTNYTANTTVGGGGYSTGSGVLNVLSTAAPFPQTGNFSVVIQSATTGNALVILRVSGINSSTQFAVVAEGTDANASSGDIVYAIISAATIDGFRADINQTGTRANLPATTNQKIGNRYKCTDSPYEFIFDGTAWRPFVFGYRVDEPLSANFSWVNQGGATITTTNGGILLKAPSNSGDSLRMQVQNALTAPFTVDVAFTMNMYQANFCSFALVGYNSSNSKVVSTALNNGANIGSGATGSTYVPLCLNCAHWTNTTTFSASPNTLNGGVQWNMYGTLGPLFWLRYYDDGTNRNTYFSSDGIIFNPVFQESNTSFVTANQVGFYIDHNNSTTNTWSSSWVVHWNAYSGAPPTTGYTV